jgi:hypothetical protein
MTNPRPPKHSNAALLKILWNIANLEHTEKTFLPKWLEITSSSIFPAIWAGFSYWNSRKTVIPALRAQKSCPNSRKNWAGRNFKPFWQECFFSAESTKFLKKVHILALNMKRIFGQIIIILAHSENLPNWVKTMLDLGETVLKNKTVFFICTMGRFLSYKPIPKKVWKIVKEIDCLATPVQDE